MIMADPCGPKPKSPGPGGTTEQKIKHARDMAEWIRCRLENNNWQPYAGICGDLEDLSDAIDDAYGGTGSVADAVQTGLQNIAEQFVDQLTTALGPPIDQDYVGWAQNAMPSYLVAAGCN